MLVAICDDDKLFRDELRSIIFSYKAELCLHIDVYEYPTGETLLASEKAFDMIFLDYQMPGIDGLEAAKELRRRNSACHIVFITNFPEFALESFEVQPFRFYEKPITEEKITALMNTFIKQQKMLAPLIVVNNREQIVVPAKEILYLEGNGKYCIVRTATKTYNSSKTLAQVHALLPQHCFYRSHKSYVVNLYSVSSFNQNSITLINGEIAELGRSKSAEFKRVYKQFIKDFYLTV